MGWGGNNYRISVDEFPRLLKDLNVAINAAKSNNTNNVYLVESENELIFFFASYPLIVNQLAPNTIDPK